MNVTRFFSAWLAAVLLSGCGALNNSAGNLLKAPYELMKGMGKAMGRTLGVVSDSRSHDSPAPASEPARGQEIAARGARLGLGEPVRDEKTTTRSMASR